MLALATRLFTAEPTEATRKEIQIVSAWADALDDDAAAKQPVGVPHDSFGRALPAGCLRVDGLFSRAECRRLVARAEERGFGVTSYPKDYRGNLRLITTDRALSRSVWERLRALAPPRLVDAAGRAWVPVGLNECWRLAKYHAGDKFERHFDAAFVRDRDRERSMLTVNIYMSDAARADDGLPADGIATCVGGATRFYAGANEEVGGDEVASITPAAGHCVIFRQPPEAYIDHDGEEVAAGVKYLFRTDIMYRRVIEPHADAAQALPAE